MAILEPVKKGDRAGDLPARSMCGVGVTGDVLTLKWRS
ncbi:hypothetical protein QF048_001681 [Streptomyces sp. W4I9-2]|nr:hypothetical protein [Streptomyces sp. W4I9-2]